MINDERIWESRVSGKMFSDYSEEIACYLRENQYHFSSRDMAEEIGVEDREALETILDAFEDHKVEKDVDLETTTVYISRIQPEDVAEVVDAAHHNNDAYIGYR